MNQSYRVQQRQHEIDQQDACKNFINTIGTLFKFMISKNANNINLLDIKDKFIIAKKEDPDLVTSSAGEYIWKYRTQIANKNVNFFLNNNFKSDINNAVNTTFTPYSTSQITDILDQIKKTWVILNKTEQEIILKLVQKMLHYYACYVKARKALQ